MTPTTISACVNKFNEGFDIVGIPQIKLEPKNYVGKCASTLRENIFKPLFFKREVLRHVGVFRPEYVLCDDLDMMIRVISSGYRLGVIDVKNGHIIHDEDNKLRSILRKTLLARKPYKKLQNNHGQKLDQLTRKHSQRKRILSILLKQPVLIPGVLFIMLVRFVARRMP
jgi:GT2 family glycosyltransferase